MFVYCCLLNRYFICGSVNVYHVKNINENISSKIVSCVAEVSHGLLCNLHLSGVAHEQFKVNIKKRWISGCLSDLQ